MLSKFTSLFLPSLTTFNKIISLPEAYKILEISNKEEAYKKYKDLIKINHPDRGGSSYLCSKINEAYKFFKKDK